MDGEQWVVKFVDGDATDVPWVEHATVTLAERAGIVVARTPPGRRFGGWRACSRAGGGTFPIAGVTEGDVELLAEQIDRPFLRDQRDEHATSG